MRNLDTATVRRWDNELAARGYTPAQLAAGVEGAVFTLGNGAVAKVWASRPRSEVLRLASFYRALKRTNLPFQTPEIHDVGTLSDATFSVERQLPGVPLSPDHPGQSPALSPSRLQCIIDVLEALAGVEPTVELQRLPALDESVPFCGGGESFNDALAHLLMRRVAPPTGASTLATSRAAALMHVVIDRLALMPPGPQGLIHGDLIPANILVGNNGHVAAVLDFGFFTTIGSPAFDAAVTSNIFDMYGPNSAESRQTMERLVADTFNYPPEALTVYLAAYALATMNLFGSTDRDGHFRWCQQVLQRPNVLKLLT